MTVEEAIELLQDDDLVEYIEPDWHVYPLATLPADDRFPQQWSLYNTGQPLGCDPNGSGGGTPGADIDAILAWDVSTGVSDPNQRPIIAVIDTGVDYTHPDLADNMWVNLAEANGTTNQDDDYNNFIDDIYGYDFSDDDDGDPYSDAQPVAGHQGHGTHVAGIAGAVATATSPSEGVAGVNWNSRIMALKIWPSRIEDAVNNPPAEVSQAIAAIEYARMMGADVINASWTIDPNCPSGCSKTLEEAIRDAGREEILFVTGSGNMDANLDSGNPNDLRYPVCYTLDSLIGVGDTDNTDALHGAYGTVSVDLGVPGWVICSTIPTKACEFRCEGCTPEFDCEERDPNMIYDTRYGSSMSAARVTGVAALLRAVKPGIPALSIKARILNNVDPNVTSGETVTGGRLNAYGAVYPEESAAPNTVNDLARQISPPQGITLTWTAPSDGGSEPVIFYDLRYSTSSITSQNFSSATRFWGVAKPVTPGSGQSTTVTGLSAYVTYYLALKAVDDWGNASSMSNVTSAQTCDTCTTSFCKPSGESSYKRCTWDNTCGYEGCCLYTCVVDPNCTAADPCPDHACDSACE